MLKMKQLIASILMLALAASPAALFSGCKGGTTDLNSNPTSTTASTADTTPVNVDFGLKEKIEDGVILHAWSWSFNTIKESMADIAAAGYSTIQTSPANEVIVGGDGGMQLMGKGKWYFQYQPTDWKIGNYQVGTEEDFKAMCQEADRYGIKIIVDVVPNHTSADKSAVSENLINSVKNQYVGKVVEDYNGGDGVRTYTDKEIESRFGYYEGISIYGKSTHVTTANQIRNFFKKGIERAVPFDKVKLTVRWCVKYPEYERRCPETEDEFFAAVKEGQDAGHQVWVSFDHFGNTEYLWEKMKRETTRKKVKVERTTGYVVTCDYRYLISAGSRNFKVNPYLEYAHVYPSFANAEKMQKRILKTYKSEIYEVIKVNGRWQLKSETEAS